MDLRERLRLMRAAGPRRPAARPEPAPETAGAPPERPGAAEAHAQGGSSPEDCRLGHGGAAAPAPARCPEASTGEPRAADAAHLPGSRIAGRLLPTPYGPAFCVETWYPLDQRRGRVRLAEVLAVPGQGWERIGRHPLWADFDPTRAAFFDTETTGLERGAGTAIFLAGVGRFVGGGFRIRQFFLRDYPEEPAFLQALAAELSEASALVTFNGKSFDWPVLTSRLVLQRQRLPEIPHLDLLYPARRLWREVVASCRLVDLEAAVLGEHRDGDIPGEQIPRLYFEYLRTGAAAPLEPVLAHNRLDILSLVALAGYLGHAAADPVAAAPGGVPLTGAELLAMGRWLLELGEPLAAARALEAALDRGLPGPYVAAGHRLLAAAYKRLAWYDKALAHWQLLAQEGRYSYEACVELAKYYEHRARDYPRAREVAQAALERLQRQRLLAGLGEAPDPRWAREVAELRHRLARLEGKLARQAGGHSPAGSQRAERESYDR
ncbi:MAG: ribonuclease H-like domain-containing protein [Firmicutes bacterium]|nr:ribonuclease H-like domain-containing protein [Bacillota bacterium]